MQDLSPRLVSQLPLALPALHSSLENQLKAASPQNSYPHAKYLNGDILLEWEGVSSRKPGPQSVTQCYMGTGTPCNKWERSELNPMQSWGSWMRLTTAWEEDGLAQVGDPGTDHVQVYLGPGNLDEGLSAAASLDTTSFSPGPP